jgi:hypothetical protein
MVVMPETLESQAPELVKKVSARAAQLAAISVIKTQNVFRISNFPLQTMPLMSYY